MTLNSTGQFEVYSRAPTWRERSPAEGERWLRSAAASGNLFAMERLAERLLKGHGVPAHHDEGIDWLQRAFNSGSIPAGHVLGAWLLEGGTEPEIHHGYSLLAKAADAGFLPAMTDFGLLLLSTDFVFADPLNGERWLREAAARGSKLAMIILSRRLEANRIERQEPFKSSESAMRSSTVTESGISGSGLVLYNSALNAVTPSIRQRLLNEAASVFLESHDHGEIVGSTNLAYLARRNEVSPKSIPSLEALLRGGLAARRPFAVVNEALRRARGVQCEIDWHQADQLIQSLSGTSGVFDWWASRAEEGDLEGVLVLAWLVRHGLTGDPDGCGTTERFKALRQTEWECPDWMN